MSLVQVQLEEPHLRSLLNEQVFFRLLYFFLSFPCLIPVFAIGLSDTPAVLVTTTTLPQDMQKPRNQR